mmetsp:Transcript_39696/g.38258  ORF Transcript_39696/g.38258 Transcript_39696/m.38258 type:complete len:128 (-) Transcript_39696:551-934(-)
MGSFSSSPSKEELFKQKYLRPGITETELNRILAAYDELIVDSSNEIISKSKLRQVNYLSIHEKELIIRGQISQYVQSLHFSEGDSFQPVILDDNNEQADFTKVMSEDQYIQENNYDEEDMKYMRPQR